MKAFVTGSTGLLGNNMVRQLLDNGYDVKAMVRSEEKGRKFLGDTTAEMIVGDMLDIPAFTHHMADCDVLFHVAAYFKEYTGADANGEAMLQTINVDGTIAIFEAAKSQGIKNIIYVSSGGVIGKPTTGKMANESAPYNHETPNRYFQSKIRAEQAIEKWLPKNPDMRVILILPGAIIGPGDNGPTGLGRLVVDVLSENLPAIPAGGFSLVDVRDVAAGMLQAIEKGKSGDRFIISGPYNGMNTLIPLIAKSGRVKAPTFQLPYPMAWLYGAVSELVSKLTGNPPLATRVLIATLNDQLEVSSAMAQDVLGVSFRPVTESVQDSVNWFKQFGYV